MEFLPIHHKDMQARGWSQVDFVYIIGDAYVDHPSFGPAVISRVLERAGYHLGIIAQPDWKNKQSINLFGQPRLGFLVSAGNMDSMVNHYSVSKRRRKQDAYSPGGRCGLRPDYATVVYCNLIKQLYKDSPIIIGGLEASLRRMAHYDYWSDSLKRSVLLDAQADILSYGMGEKSIVEIADALQSGLSPQDITFVKGTVFLQKQLPDRTGMIRLPDYETLLRRKESYAESFMIQLQNNDPVRGRPLYEYYQGSGYIVQNPPQPPLRTEEMDAVYELPYMRDSHPVYQAEGGIAALEEVKFSITNSRGCFGACNFCAIAFHQGRFIQSRSHESVVREAVLLTELPGFKGYIHDLGGPTANFTKPACKHQQHTGACKDKQCLFPAPCKNLAIDHSDYVQLLRKLRAVQGIKKVFVRSGVRFDYVMADRDPAFLTELCAHHISGQLKVAPEHISANVLDKMGKPRAQVYFAFEKAYKQTNARLKKEQYLVPYLMSSHPGSTLQDAVKLAEFLRDTGHMPQQVQDFYPTPSTVSTCMYYTGLDPRTCQSVYIPKSAQEKAMQRALIQYKSPQNYALVRQALLNAGRADLIGFGAKCLIRPQKFVHPASGHDMQPSGTAPAARGAAGRQRKGSPPADPPQASGGGKRTPASKTALQSEKRRGLSSRKTRGDNTQKLRKGKGKPRAGY